MRRRIQVFIACLGLITGLITASPILASDSLSLDGQLLQGSLIRGKVTPGSDVTLNGKPLSVSAQGHFVIGFSRDEDKEHSLVVTYDGESTHRVLTPSKREYRIQRIDGLDQKKVTPPESVLQRIRNDAAMVRTARSGVSDLKGFVEDFIWPSDGVISGVYGSQRILNGKPSRPHFGVDIAAPKGADVVAPASGKVTMAHPDLYYSGGTVIIDHGLGVYSTFLHLDTIDVKVGDLLAKGDKFAEVGSTGRSTGPHLDWRINWESVRLDPALLVAPRDGLDYVKPSE